MSAPSAQSEDLRNDVQFLAHARMGQSVLVWGELSNRLLGCADHIDALEAENERLGAEVERLRELLAKTAGVLQVAMERKTKPYDTIIFGGPRFASTGGVVVSDLLDEVEAALADQTGGAA